MGLSLVIGMFRNEEPPHAGTIFQKTISLSWFPAKLTIWVDGSIGGKCLHCLFLKANRMGSSHVCLPGGEIGKTRPALPPPKRRSCQRPDPAEQWMLLWAFGGKLHQGRSISCFIALFGQFCAYNLVGGVPTPLKNMKVNWDYYSQYTV